MTLIETGCTGLLYNSPVDGKTGAGTQERRDSIEETLTAGGRGGGADFSNFKLPSRWEPIRILGAGGQAVVWLASDAQLHELVAIKVHSNTGYPAAVERFKREVRIGRRLQHPNLIRIFELVESEDSMALVMEYLEGGSLAERAKQGALELPELLRIAEDMLSALSAMHEEDLVHRDVKPSNILLDSQGKPKLADFGTLKMLEEDLGLTATEMAVGTPAFMSPEQLRGEEIGPASDLYSLGVTLFTLAAGRLPFEAASNFEIAHRTLSENAPPLRSLRSDCPRWFGSFVDRLLAREAEDRWPDAGAALKAFSSRRWRPRPKRLVRPAMMLLAVLFVTGLGVFASARLSSFEVDIRGESLRASDIFGRTLWQQSIPGLASQILKADLLPEPGEEVVVPVFSWEDGIRKLSLRFLSRKGELLREQAPVSPESWRISFPSMTVEPVPLKLEMLDLGPGLGRTAVGLVNDRSMYPGALILWKKERETFQVLFRNSGHIRDIATVDVDGDGQREILVTGINNELGFQGFLAVLDPRAKSACSPEIAIAEEISRSSDALISYALLGQISDEGLLVRKDQAAPFGLAMGHGDLPPIILGPEGGVAPFSAAQLKRFWVEICLEKSRLSTGEQDFKSTLSWWREKGRSAFWDALPYRFGASLIFANALALSGRPEQGAELLRSCADSSKEVNRRILRRWAELEFIAGHREKARAIMHRAIGMTGKGFGPVDECQDIALSFALEQDDGWEEIRQLFSSFRWEYYLHEMDVVHSFFEGDFRTCSAVEIEMRPGQFFPALVLQKWAAIERGASDETTIRDLQQLRIRSECGALARLALARAELLDGNSGGGSDAALNALSNIRDRARTSWPERVMLPLAQWSSASLLEAQGAFEEALELYSQAAAAAPNTFFGRESARAAARIRGK